MSIIVGKTSIVFNHPNKEVGLPLYYYRYRVCDTNLNCNTPADQYQKLKLIQNTVRVQGSLYTANLGPLSAYKKPISDPNIGFHGVCWNQMSDRPVPSVQRATIPTGYNTSMNRRHTSVTSSKPGSQTPGGVGCDIKHNSYDRYLNRIKGKGPVRRGPIPPDFGHPIIVNPAGQRVQGGKTMKTSIVSGCNCPIASNNNEKLIYQSLNAAINYGAQINFKVGDYVYAKENNSKYYSRAIINEINGSIYTITFDDGTANYKYATELLFYFPCNCDSNTDNLLELSEQGQIVLNSANEIITDCSIINNPQNIEKYIINVMKNFYENNF